MSAHFPSLREFQILTWSCLAYQQWCAYTNFAEKFYGPGITQVEVELSSDFDSDLGEWYFVRDVRAYKGKTLRLPDPDCLEMAGFQSGNSPDSMEFAIEMEEFIADFITDLPLPTAFGVPREQETITVRLDKLPAEAQLALRVRLEDE